MEIYMSQPLRGQNALITGASSGIGEAIARRFAAVGAAVGINYHSRSESADRIVEEVRAGGGTAGHGGMVVGSLREQSSTRGASRPP